MISFYEEKKEELTQQLYDDNKNPIGFRDVGLYDHFVVRIWYYFQKVH